MSEEEESSSRHELSAGVKYVLLISTYQVGQDDQDAEGVLMRDEEDEDELDEVHEALKAGLDPTHSS